MCEWANPVTPLKWKWKSLSHVRLCDPVDCTVHGILQARILEWVAFPFSRKSKVRFQFDIKFMPHHKQKHMETRKLKILFSPAMMFSISSHKKKKKILKSTSIGLFNLVILNFSLLLFNFSFNLLLEFRTWTLSL